MKLCCQIFLCFFFCISSQISWAQSAEEAIQSAHSLKLSEDRQWILLGHYKKKLWGAWQSEVADSNFFASPQGATDPGAELDALLQSLWAPTPVAEIDQDPRCRFPARLSWLKKKLNLKFPSEEQDPILQQCLMYKRYRSVIQAESFSFIFSAYYANSPGSAFGHTLFRINKKSSADGRHSELLDHGVGYAAQVTVSNPALYALFGLTGFFKGIFTNLPYYYKVREYNDYEFRDLWSYDLNLTTEEVDLMAKHLWEVGNSYFHYYFLTQNCAYHMLTVLEAAAPRYHVTERIPLYVIPSDTIKAINAEPGLVNDVHFRPALRSVFLQRYERLDLGEQSIFRDYKKNLDLSLLLSQPVKQKINLLDTALDYIDVVFPENLFNPKSAGAQHKNEVLQARAAIPVVSEHFEPRLPENQRPDMGHGSTRASLGLGSNYLGKATVEVELRFALHDLMDPHLGYPEYSQLEFGHIRGQLQFDTHQIRLDEFDIFRVTAMNPLSLFQDKMSWRIHLGAHRFKLGACDQDCIAAGFGFGSGFAQHLDSSQNFLGYLLLEGEAYYDVHFREQPFKLDAGPTAGLLTKIGPRLKWMIENTYLFQAVRSQNEAFQFSTELRYHFANNWNLGLRYMNEQKSDETFLTLHHFY